MFYVKNDHIIFESKNGAVNNFIGKTGILNVNCPQKISVYGNPVYV